MSKKIDSSENAVVVKNLHKTFRLPNEQSSGLKQVILNAFRKNKKKGYTTQKVLNGISFEVKKGEFFGIVGRNGSGKSTLLKLLAGIYTPDKGAVRTNGTLVPFIELGVGFNPELTGRENIFLNGALLGFSHKEMEAMYDEIVDFAELHKFMDQKLKNYSSGMQVRLAFSIAIKAQGDVLILDEVLAVGDEAFQRKCNDFFDQIKKDKTKTVILVTHSMGSVKQYCSRAVLIENGEIKVIGSPDDVANQYTLDNLTMDEPAGHLELKEGMILNYPVNSIVIRPISKLVLSRDEKLEFEVECKSSEELDNTYIGISLLYNNISVIEHGTVDAKPVVDEKGRVVFRYRLSLERFTQGDFSVSAAVLDLKTKEPLAFTTGRGNLNVAIRNKGKHYGGLLIDRGEWVV